MGILGRDAQGILREYTLAEIDAATTATFLARDAKGILREYTATQLDTATATLHGRDSLGLLRDYTAAAIAATTDETPYYNAVMADSPVAYYRMGEASGGVVDATGGTAGVASGTVTRDVAGALATDNDGAITFGGGLVTVADQAKLDLGNGPFSLEAWVKRSGTSWAAVLNKGAGAFLLYFFSDDKLTFEAQDSGSTTIQETGTTADTAWHHLVATWSGTVAKLYKDGVSVGDTQTSTPTFVSTNDVLAIGAMVGGSLPFAGRIDEVALYDTVLSAARVLAHYNAGVGA